MRYFFIDTPHDKSLPCEVFYVDGAFYWSSLDCGAGARVGPFETEAEAIADARGEVPPDHLSLNPQGDFS